MIPWLSPAASPERFPPVESAAREPNGLLAGGGDLSPQRLLAAYRRGIFPWYGDGQPILWWSPDPRAVFPAGGVHCARRLARTIRSRRPRLVLDRAFGRVVAACAAPRAGEPGTWITADMRTAYRRLFALGAAHCAEVEIDGEVLGGVYGVAIGRVFFGESMFSAARDGSKLALVGLDRWLAASGYALIDAQVESGHIARLGAQRWPRARFLRTLATLCDEAPLRPLGPGTAELAELVA